MTEGILYENLTDHELLATIAKMIVRHNEKLSEICQGIEEIEPLSNNKKRSLTAPLNQ